ncbi:MAG: hypothetical protein ABIR52_03885, partial [Casimicrobiaceae bacterium]
MNTDRFICSAPTVAIAVALVVSGCATLPAGGHANGARSGETEAIAAAAASAATAAATAPAPAPTSSAPGAARPPG